jgi:mannose-6-phosphate isomerase-like protein (cupin superfamily)
MDLEAIKSAIVTNVYHIKADKKVALHQHKMCNELFYCIQGEGFGVLENEEIKLTKGKVFVVPVGVMHALRTDSNLWVTSFLIPIPPENL